MVPLLIIPLGGLVEVKAEFPQVFVYPSSQIVDTVGNGFVVNVSVSDVFNLYAYEFKLYYNSTVLNGTSVSEGSFLGESGQSPFFYPEAFTDHFNSTYGIVWVDSTLVGDVPGVDGSGVLAALKFKATAPTNSTSLLLGYVNLTDPSENQIPFISSNGTVTVLPEFTETAAILTLILASILTLFVSRKMRKSLRF